MMSPEAGPRWDLPPPQPRLAPGAVHLWRIWLDRDAAAQETAWALLAPEERQRASSWLVPHERQRFVIRRAQLRRILGAYLTIHPATLQFSYGPTGKPELVGIPALQFSVACAGAWALIGVAALPIGVDLERMHTIPDADQIVAQFFAPEEQLAWQALAPELRPLTFLRAWVSKEAGLKARGTGLSTPLDGVVVSLDPAGPPCYLRMAGAATGTAGWTLRIFAPAADLLAAVALPTPSPLAFHCWRDDGWLSGAEPA